MQALVHVPTSIVAVTPLLNIMLCTQGCSGWQVVGDRSLSSVPTFPESMSELHDNL